MRRLIMNGILPLWKPRGMTSHDCVMKVRKLLKTRKVGHTGTLDPEVEGVLVVCVGQATKIVPFLTAMDKTYIAECSLGIATETEDAFGSVVPEKEFIASSSNKDIQQTMKLFRGEIAHSPTLYSAVKVKGTLLYEYARATEYVERTTRKITIHTLQHLKNDTEHNQKFT